MTSHLIEALKSKHKSVQYWSGQIASLFPDVSLLEPLEKMLNSDDGDVRIMAVIALDSIKHPRVIDMLSERLLIEKEEDVIEFIKKTLDDLKGE